MVQKRIKNNKNLGTMKNSKYTAKFINKNFRIKVYGLGMNTLLGVKGALELLGEHLYQFITRALQHGKDKEVCKLRRGLVVTLYAK